jgi:hypothetical protein
VGLPRACALALLALLLIGVVKRRHDDRLGARTYGDEQKPPEVAIYQASLCAFDQS